MGELKVIKCELIPGFEDSCLQHYILWFMTCKTNDMAKKTLAAF